MLRHLENRAHDHQRLETRYMAQMQKGVIGEVAVDLDNATSTSGKWRNVGLPCDATMAVLRYIRLNNGDMGKHPAFMPLTLEFAEAWCHPRYLSVLDHHIMQPDADEPSWIEPPLKSLPTDHSCCPPLSTTRKAIELLAKIDQNNGDMIKGGISEQSVLEALTEMGVQDFKRDARLNEHELRDSLVQYLRLSVSILQTGYGASVKAVTGYGAADRVWSFGEGGQGMELR